MIAGCRLCDGGLRGLFSLPATPPANAFAASAEEARAQPTYPLELVLCSSCGAVQLKHTVDPKLLFSDYLYRTSSNPGLVKHFNDSAPHLAEMAGLCKGDLIVSLGSNDGADVAGLKRLGYSTLGIEPSRRLADIAEIPTICDFWSSKLATTLALTHKAPKLIFAANVFAHVGDLAGFLAGVRSWLHTLGTFVFETVYLKNLVESGSFDLEYHEHLFPGHGIQPLAAFFARHGFTLEHVELIPTHGGSIRGYVRRGEIPPTSSLRGLALEELDSGLYEPETWRLLEQRIQSAKVALRSHIDSVRWGRANGGGTVGTVAAYGAPAKLTTFCYALGIEASDLSYVVDDAPWKQGKFTPGLGIPVVPLDRLLKNPPDLLLISAWNCAESIIDKVQGLFVARGKRPPQILVPFPELKLW